MPVRVLGRSLEVAVKRLEQPIADVVLELLGILVHIGQVEPEHANEKCFQDPVTPHDAQRLAAATAGDAAAALPRD